MNSTIKSAITLATVAAFSFAGGAFASSVGTKIFYDMPADHWAADAIQYVSEQGLMTGPGHKAWYFEPDAVVTRAQLAMVLYRAGLQTTLPSPMPTEERARDAQRRSDVNTILNAIYQYAIDNNGSMPAAFTQSFKEICKSDEDNCTGMIDLEILTGMYLVHIPSDPQSDSDDRGTNYFVSMDSLGRITVEARNAEEATIISVTR